MPSAEILLWLKIKGRQINGCKFRRQYGIGKYIVDFYCPKAKLAIEIDGDSHFLDKPSELYDKERQRYIESLGLHMIRFLNTDIYNSLEAVVEKIKEAIK